MSFQANAALPPTPLRRGLPRTAGGDAWPMPLPVAPRSDPATPLRPLRRGLPRVPGGAPWPDEAQAAAPHSRPAPHPAEPPAPPAQRRRIVPPLPREPRRIAGFTPGAWAAILVFGTVAAVTLAAGVVACAQWLMGLPSVQGFVARYPGAVELPDHAPIGVPAWMGWQHFFNVFLMALVIRSGIQIRRSTSPQGFWSPRWNLVRKISLTIWFHQALDLLWVLNGIVFVVLLACTGQWLKIVPTTWEVFPHAASALLQYLSLDWPTENGWVHYNALQQISYFLTVFVAAPLAALTGVRMSGLWPKHNALLNRIYPVQLARKLHFPVMLYFIAFIIVHVGLVFATGALRNLNHMYAAQGSVDPEVYAANWTGFFMFAGSMLVVFIALIAARPPIIAPVARLFGTVSQR